MSVVVGPARTGARRLALLQVAYGAALLGATAPVLEVVDGRQSAPSTTTVAKVLGARELAQAVVTLWRPRRSVLWAGAAVDATHALSMVALAVVAPDRRRPAVASAAMAALLALAALRVARRAAP